MHQAECRPIGPPYHIDIGQSLVEPECHQVRIEDFGEASSVFITSMDRKVTLWQYRAKGKIRDEKQSKRLDARFLDWRRGWDEGPPMVAARLATCPGFWRFDAS